MRRMLHGPLKLLNGSLKLRQGSSNALVQAVSTKHKNAAPRKHRAYEGRWDDIKLWQLGYKQELPRTMTMFNNMSACFSVLSFFAVVDTFGSQGLAYGGPVSVIWGWIICSFFSLVVAACLAELLSAFPVAGGMYYCAFALAPLRHRTLVCWVAGWLNLFGQACFTAGLEYSLAHGIATAVYLNTGGPSGGGVLLSGNTLLGLVALLLTAHAVLNSISSAATAYFNSISFFWHVVATVGLCAATLCTARHLNGASYVFGQWTPYYDTHGIHSPTYIFLLGLLMSQWIIMSYDASVNMAEETINSEFASCYAMVGAVLCCCLGGFALLLCLLFAMQDQENILSFDNETGGRSAVVQLLWDVFKSRYGSGAGAIGLSYIPLVGLFLCANSSLCSNARKLYAFSRDGAVPGYRVWRRVASGSKLPRPATWAMALLAFLIAAPCCYHDKIFTTVSAGSVVCLSLSYGIPIALRACHNRHTFIPGPLNLGRWSRPLGILSCCWILLVTVVFMLPTEYPVTAANVNYTAPWVAAVLIIALSLFYAPRFGGRAWFKGPTQNLGS